MSEEEKTTKPTPQTPTPETVDTEWVPSKDCVEAYSNVIHMNWAAFEVRIRFGQTVPEPRNIPSRATKWAVEERAVITMSWGQVKYARDLMTRVIDEYEKLNGEIKAPTIPSLKS
ncbi:MAG: DUF3467 domain-containing protein [Candidatus Korobacteraceae bacterium]|jgi:hypothetical protein